MSPADLISYLHTHYGAFLPPGQLLIPAPKDIDLYLDTAQKSNVIAWAKGRQEVSMQFLAKEKIMFYTVHEKRLYMFDLTFSSNYISEYYNFDFDAYFATGTLDHDDIEEIRTLRFFLLQRTSNENITYVAARSDVLKRYLPPRVFATAKLEQKTIEAFMKRKLWGIFVLLGMSGTLRYYANRSRVVWRRINTGKIVAVVGPDGSGKSSILAPLSSWNIKIMYFGDKDFYFQNIYTALFRFRATKPLAYAGVYFEQWLRYARAQMYVFWGIKVVCDRYPGYNFVAHRDPKVMRIYDALYSVFPKPASVIFLNTPTELILHRSSELTLQEIDYVKAAIKAKMRTKGDHIFDNVGFVDEGANFVLKALLSDNI